MNLELNNTYKTRDGGYIKITDIDYSYSRPFFGTIKTETGKHIMFCSYLANGMVYGYKESGLDIVEEMK